MIALAIYLLAGIGFCWSLPGKPWQRALLIVVWLPMIGYGMLNEFISWLGTKGYKYETENDDPLP